MEQLVRFRDWVFAVDREETQATYAATKTGGAESCTCVDCRNFAVARSQVYPLEALSLFDALGIDYRKESEVFRYSQLDNGMHFYGGWFHFKGRLLEGGEYELGNLAHFTDQLALGFTAGNAPSIFSNTQGLVQVEIEAKIPWLLNEAYSS